MLIDCCRYYNSISCCVPGCVHSELCLLSAQMELSLNSQEAGVYRNAEEECASLCHVARLHAEQVG